MTEHLEPSTHNSVMSKVLCKVLSALEALWVATIFLDLLKKCLQNLFDKARPRCIISVLYTCKQTVLIRVTVRGDGLLY